MPIRLALNTGPSAPGFNAHSLTRLWRGESDRGDVVAVDENDEERPDNQFDLKRAQSAFVEQS